MLATLAIINLAVAAVLINETADERTQPEPTAIVAVADTETSVPVELAAK